MNKTNNGETGCHHRNSANRALAQFFAGPVFCRCGSLAVTVITFCVNITFISNLKISLSTAAQAEDEWMPTIFEFDDSATTPQLITGETYLFKLAEASVSPSQKGYAVGGDFNQWQPAPMHKNNGHYWLALTLANASGIKFKFYNRDTSTWISAPNARYFTYDHFGKIGFVEPPRDQWYLECWLKMAHPQLDLLPRDLIVYVPKGAYQSHVKRSVLYMHDGQNLFAPDSMMGGWKMQEALAGAEANAVRQGKTLPYVVGIFNTERRLDDYTHVKDRNNSRGDGAKYAKFLEETVRPFIEATYPTSDVRGVMGSSLGGLISLYINLLYPESYQFVGALSPSLGWGHISNIPGTPSMLDLYRTLAIGAAKPLLYLDSGGGMGAAGCRDFDGDGTFEDDPENRDGYCDTRQFADVMADEFGYQWNVNLFHWWGVGEPHNEIAWSQRVKWPLSLFISL